MNIGEEVKEVEFAPVEEPVVPEPEREVEPVHSTAPEPVKEPVSV